MTRDKLKKGNELTDAISAQEKHLCRIHEIKSSFLKSFKGELLGDTPLSINLENRFSMQISPLAILKDLEKTESDLTETLNRLKEAFEKL